MKPDRNLKCNKMEENIKSSIIETYPRYNAEIDKIIESIFDRQYQNDLQKEWYDNDDFRNGIFQIYLSILYNQKTKIYLVHNFIDSDDFLKQFYTVIMPRENKDKINPALYILANLDIELRFDFFLKFYSQFESIIRRISRKFKLKKEPFRSVFKELNILNDNFLMKIDTIRNSIHNAGLHIPLDSHKKQVVYQSSEAQYKLHSGDAIQFSWEETFETIYEIINFTYKIVETNKIKDLPLNDL